MRGNVCVLNNKKVVTPQRHRLPGVSVRIFPRRRKFPRRFEEMHPQFVCHCMCASVISLHNKESAVFDCDAKKIVRV